MRTVQYINLFKDTIKGYSKDQVPQLGAALAFYSMLSIGPLLLLALSTVGLFFDKQIVQGKIVAEIRALIGPEGARTIQDMLESAAKNEHTGIVAAVVAIVTLLMGASGAFGQLQNAMNIIWKVEPEDKSSFWDIVQKRFLSFSMVLGTSFLLLLSLVISTGLAAMSAYTTQVLNVFSFILPLMDVVINIGILSFLFALLFKYLPDTHIDWHDVWVGAVLTAILFIIGKSGIGFYLGKASVGSAYGAAGSLIVILVWVYYTAQILFLGAEFTYAYATHHGTKRVTA